MKERKGRQREGSWIPGESEYGKGRNANGREEKEERKECRQFRVERRKKCVGLEGRKE